MRGLFAAALIAAAFPTAAQVTPTQPEVAVGRSAAAPATARRYVVAAGHALAAEAGRAMLDRGGSAVDAMIASQLVLTLVEPQSSGIGGGAFLLHYDARTKRVAALDAREQAPLGADASLLLHDGKPIPFREAVVGGRAVGVPGVPRLLEVAHARYGKLPWAALFGPAIRIAEEGFPISARLHRALVLHKALAKERVAGAYFFTPAGEPKPIGTVLRNPELAATLRKIAAHGADAFYTGEIAADIVATVQAQPNPGSITADDLARYRVRDAEPVCASYRARILCGMPPPSSGGIAVLQMLGVLSRFDLAHARPGSAEAVHLFSEAGRLAFADRARYLGDDRFIDVPVKGLLDPAYLAERSKLVAVEKSMGAAQAGNPPGTRMAFADVPDAELAGTSHISIVDSQGDVVAMTTSIEALFGSFRMVRGFLLNNTLTDFDFTPVADGRIAANAAGPGKRPRSSMSPFIVLDAATRRAEMSLGSSGGSFIINYVAKALVATIDWKMDMQAAIELANFGSRNGPTELEKGTELERLGGALKAMGHAVSVIDMPSGLQGIRRTRGGWEAGSDPRREGAARGR
jgi:gamma-glutamyltranspeptidase / glutathione hydrolase